MNDEPQPPTEDAKALLYKELGQFVRLVVLILVVIALGKALLFETSPVHGPSMEPTLHSDERILVFKLPMLARKLPMFQWLDPIQPGEFVVFRSADEAGKRYIKRVIAKGPPTRRGGVEAKSVSEQGVQVRFERGAVYVNNRLLEEPYLDPEERVSPERADVVLGPGEYYVLGDHRSVSKDSRRIGPVAEGDVVGEAVWRVWPLSKFGPL
jgi:signal peptidase I